MKDDTVILVVDEDGDCFKIIENNLRRSGILNEIKHFESSDEFWSFFRDIDDSGKKTYSFVVILECEDGLDVAGNPRIRPAANGWTAIRG